MNGLADFTHSGQLFAVNCKRGFPMIEACDIYKTYRRRKGLLGVSFLIDQGEKVGLLGPEGSGKTTLIKLLSGSVSPSGGELFVGDIDAVGDPCALRRMAGYLPDPLMDMGNMTAEECLDWTYDLKQLKIENRFEHIMSVCRMTGLDRVYGRMAKRLTLRGRTMIALAQALIGAPDILLADEPGNGLPRNDALALRKLIFKAAEGRTLLISSCNEENLESCDRILELSNGRIVGERFG